MAFTKVVLGQIVQNYAQWYNLHYTQPVVHDQVFAGLPEHLHYKILTNIYQFGPVNVSKKEH